MYARMDFDPADDDENEVFGIDFVFDLSRVTPGEQLVSAIFEIKVISGTDATPNSHKVGSPAVMENPQNQSGLVTMAVQRISGLLKDVVYCVQAVAFTNQGNTISLWARVAVGEPPEIIWSA